MAAQWLFTLLIYIYGVRKDSVWAVHRTGAQHCGPLLEAEHAPFLFQDFHAHSGSCIRHAPNLSTAAMLDFAPPTDPSTMTLPVSGGRTMMCGVNVAPSGSLFRFASHAARRAAACSYRCSCVLIWRSWTTAVHHALMRRHVSSSCAKRQHVSLAQHCLFVAFSPAHCSPEEGIVMTHALVLASVIAIPWQHFVAYAVSFAPTSWNFGIFSTIESENLGVQQLSKIKEFENRFTATQSRGPP